MIRHLAAALAAAFLAPPVCADILIEDAYVRSSTPSAATAAAFMTLRNDGAEDDRLLGASSAAAARVELHAHSEDANGVMRMGEIDGGIALPAGGMHALARGGDHVMLMGLTAVLEQGAEIEITLDFEKAGKVAVRVPVDHARKPGHEAMGHGSDG